MGPSFEGGFYWCCNGFIRVQIRGLDWETIGSTLEEAEG